MNANHTQPSVPVVKKKLGTTGETYIVGARVRQDENGECWYQITIVETGVTAEYRWSDILQDEEAD